MSKIPKVEIITLKEEFLAIQKDALYKPLTKVLIQELIYKYEELFAIYGLNDLRWTLTTRENEIEFVPLREIDKYALIGIMNCDK